MADNHGFSGTNAEPPKQGRDISLFLKPVQT
jgi:hypothetical protein